jgi:hypothetical protein
MRFLPFTGQLLFFAEWPRGAGPGREILDQRLRISPLFTQMGYAGGPQDRLG